MKTLNATVVKAGRMDGETMPINLKSINIGVNQPAMAEKVDDALIERLWHELDGQITPEQIANVAGKIACEYQNASVKVFVPILIHKKALDHFKKLLGENRGRAEAQGS